MEIENLKDVNFTLQLYGDKMDFMDLAFKHKGKEFAESLFDDNYFSPAEIDCNGDYDGEDYMEIEIKTLDELQDYLVCFKKVKLTLRQSVKLTRGEKDLLEYRVQLENETQIDNYMSRNRSGQLRCHLEVISESLMTRINNAIKELNGIVRT